MISEIDFQRVKYDPTIHSAFILNKIVNFNSTYSNLVTVDALTGIPAVGAAFLLATGSLSLLGCLVICTGLYFGRKKLDRSVCRTQFMNEFTKLMEIYEWCCRTGGDRVTHDETFLKLLKVILPFYAMDAEMLVPKQGDLSDQFRELFSEPPHFIRFSDPKKTPPSLTTKITSYVGSYFPSPEIKQEVVIKKKQTGYQLPRLFSVPIAHLTLAAYACDENKKKESKNEEKSKMTAQVLSLIR